MGHRVRADTTGLHQSTIPDDTTRQMSARRVDVACSREDDQLSRNERDCPGIRSVSRASREEATGTITCPGIGSVARALIMVKEFLHLARVGTIGMPKLMPVLFTIHGIWSVSSEKNY